MKSLNNGALLYFKCDLCGTYYDSYNLKEKFGSEYPSYTAISLGDRDSKHEFRSVGNLDCCPDCMKDVCDVVQEKLKQKGE